MLGWFDIDGCMTGDIWNLWHKIEDAEFLKRLYSLKCFGWVEELRDLILALKWITFSTGRPVGWKEDDESWLEENVRVKGNFSVHSVTKDGEAYVKENYIRKKVDAFINEFHKVSDETFLFVENDEDIFNKVYERVQHELSRIVMVLIKDGQIEKIIFAEIDAKTLSGSDISLVLKLVSLNFKHLEDEYRDMRQYLAGNKVMFNLEHEDEDLFKLGVIKGFVGKSRCRIY